MSHLKIIIGLSTKYKNNAKLLLSSLIFYCETYNAMCIEILNVVGVDCRVVDYAILTLVICVND